MKKIVGIILLSIVFICPLSFAASAKKLHHHPATTYSSGYSGGMPSKISPPGEREFIFNPAVVKWGAYDAQGNLVAQGVANGGKSFCPDSGHRCFTPTGTYRVLSKGAASCKSTIYPIKHIGGRVVRGGAPMAYCMFFSNYFAIHGSNEIGGHNASHGCIRVTNSAALWLSQNFIKIGTKVRVLSY